MRQIIFRYPGGNSEVSISRVSNFGLMFFIPLHMASYQSVFPLSSWNDFDSAAYLGISTPIFLVRTEYLVSIPPII